MCRRKFLLSVLWRVLYDSLCHSNPGLEEGSNTLEPFALDFELVCIVFLYDCSVNLRDSNSVEEAAILATYLKKNREGTIAIIFQVENLEFLRIIQSNTGLKIADCVSEIP
jgi:hypothetical protein